jgi:hypothetical protein
VAIGYSKYLTEENPSINMNLNLELMNYDNRNSTKTIAFHKKDLQINNSDSERIPQCK